MDTFSVLLRVVSKLLEENAELRRSLSARKSEAVFGEVLRDNPWWDLGTACGKSSPSVSDEKASQESLDAKRWQTVRARGLVMVNHSPEFHPSTSEQGAYLNEYADWLMTK